MAVELDLLIDNTLFKTTTDGLSGTGVLAYDGSTLQWKQDPVVPKEGYGCLTSSVDSALSLTAVTDLKASTGYVPLTTATMWVSGPALYEALDTTNGKIIVDNAGVYEVKAWVSVVSDTLNTSIGVKYLLNGTTYSTETMLGTVKDVGDSMNLSAGSIQTLSSGDELSLQIAADTDSNVTVKSAGFMVTKLSN